MTAMGTMGVGDDVSVNHPVVELGTVRLRTRKVVCVIPASVRVAKNRPSGAPLASRNDSAKAIVFGNGLLAVISVQVIEPSATSFTFLYASTYFLFPFQYS